MALLGLGLVACPSRTQGVAIARGARLSLLSPALLGHEVVASQIFRAQFGGKTQVFYVQLEVDEGRIAMVGLTPIGARLFSLIYAKGKLRYVPQPFFRARLQPAHVLADFQLAYWPHKILSRALRPQGLELREQLQKGLRTRQLRRGSRVLIEIRYSHPTDPWRGSLRFEHKERKYRFSIRTAQVHKGPVRSR